MYSWLHFDLRNRSASEPADSFACRSRCLGYRISFRAGTRTGKGWDVLDPPISFAISRILVVVALLWLAVMFASGAATAQYAFTTLSFPGATNTYATGIDGTNIVGYYVSNNIDQGFLYNGSTYTTLSVPGAKQTEANGISGTNIVGAYLNPYGYWNGFEYNGSTWAVYLDMPGASQTWPMGVSGNYVVGYDWGYVGTTELYTNFVYNGSDFSGLIIPGATFYTEAYGVSGTNIVGGYDILPAGGNGFWYNGKSYVILTVPGASTTTATGISGSNIVGNCNSSSGFIYNTISKTYTTLSMPNGQGIVPFGISGNHIVGYYVNRTGTYGFLATPSASLRGTNVAGQFRLTVSGPSYPTIIEVSSNILDWANVYTNTPPFTFTDSASTSLSRRFYRALVPQ